MIHNDTLRQLRYALTLNDKKLIAIFKLVNYDISAEELAPLLKKDTEDGFISCRDRTMAAFLDGLIIHYRGRQPGYEPALLPAKVRLSNNEILRKLRIALQLRDDDIIALMASVDFRVSKSEVSALFRKPEHRNFKVCGDQFLRNLIKGLTKKHRLS